jgi:transposase InsO family protein
MEKKKKQLGGKKSRFSDAEKRKLIRKFRAHRGPKREFFQAQGVTTSAVYRWIKEGVDGSPGKAPASKRQGHGTQVKARGSNSPERRKEAVEAYLKSGRTFGEFAKIWGVSSKSLSKWCRIYEERGAAALESGIYGTAKRGRKGSSPHIKAQIVSVQSENPSFGLKKVRDFLYRFRGVKVSTGTVRKTVKEAKLPRAPLPPKKRRKAKDKIRRFERSKPMQMWQSDITSFVLTRHSQRVYLTVFIDDHSRYIVSWSLQLRQKSDLVMDSLLSCEKASAFGYTSPYTFAG